MNKPVVPGQCQFPRSARITRKTDYHFVFQHGTKRVGPQFICYWVRREALGRRLGVAVSRKVGNAVVRNRVKRYVREFFRAHRRFLVADMQLVVVARPSSAQLPYRECAGAIAKLLRLGGVLDDHAGAS